MATSEPAQAELKCDQECRLLCSCHQPLLLQASRGVQSRQQVTHGGRAPNNAVRPHSLPTDASKSVVGFRCPPAPLFPPACHL